MVFVEIFKYGLLYPTPFTDQGQIWHSRVNPWCTLPHHISHQSVNIFIYVTTYNHTNFTNFVIFTGLLYPSHRQSEPNLAGKNKPTINIYMANFIRTALLCRPWGWKLQILPHFPLQRCVLAPPSSTETKFNAGE